MKRFIAGILAVSALTAAPVVADYYVAGDFNGWNPSGNIMTDIGGGIWQLNLANVGGRHEFKVTIGDWSQNWPESNSWFFGDSSGNVTLTFNVNDVQDGWRGNWGRIGLSTDPGTWTAVGDWQGWNNADNNMTTIGGGVYRYSQNVVPGWHEWKAVVTGSWDAIGDNFRSTSAATTWFEVTSQNPVVMFEVNALTGVERVYTVPAALPGDYNHDGSLDAADYVFWRKTGGSPDDYITWRTHFGQIGSIGSSYKVIVPEPESLMLLIGAAAVSPIAHYRGALSLSKLTRARATPTM